MEKDSSVPDLTSSNKNQVETFLNIKRILIVNVIGICLLSIGSQFFTEIESNWMNSYFFIYNLSGLNSKMIFVGVMSAMNAIFGTIFFIIWGVISDNLRTRFGRRKPIIFLGFIGTGLLLIIFAFSPNMWFTLLLGGIFIPIISNMIHMSGKVVTADLIPPNKRGRTNLLVIIAASIASFSNWIPTILNLPQGENEVYSLSIHRIFMIVAAFVLFITGAGIFLVMREPKIESPPNPFWKDIAKIGDVKELRENKEFFILFVASLFVIMNQNSYLPYILILIQEIDLTMEQMLIASVVVGLAVGVVLGITTKLIDKIGRKKLIIPALIISPIGGVLLVTIGQNFWTIILCFAIIFPFSTVVGLCTDTMTQDLLPEHARGRYIGIFRIGTAIGRAIGVLVTGGIVSLMAGLPNAEMWMFFSSGLWLWIAIPFFLRVPETLTFKKQKTITQEKNAPM